MKQKRRSGAGDADGGRRSAARSEQNADAAEGGLARRAWDQVWPLGVAVLLALTIRAVVIESYYVPSESMLPSLLIGDHVFVNKFVYGAKVPFMDVHLPAVRDPHRGEIVVFALGRSRTGGICPLDQCPGYRAEGFIKRVVGLPGDHLEFRRGTLYVNGAPVALRDTGEVMTDDAGREFNLLEETVGECVHEVGEHPKLPGVEMRPMTVPEGRYFMMGDNRDNSNDSRRWGTVRREDLKGPAFVIYWSWNNRESWLAMLNPFTWIRLIWGETRWGRFGDSLSCGA